MIFLAFYEMSYLIKQLYVTLEVLWLVNKMTQGLVISILVYRLVRRSKYTVESGETHNVQTGYIHCIGQGFVHWHAKKSHSMNLSNVLWLVHKNLETEQVSLRTNHTMVTEFVAIAPQFCHTYTPYYTDTACIVNERGIFIEFEMTLKAHALYKENNLSSPFLIFFVLEKSPTSTCTWYWGWWQ